MGIKIIYGLEELSSIYIDARLVIFSCLNFTLRSDVLCLACLANLSYLAEKMVALLQFQS